jgi:aminoglycoside phosphotransferase family enzyme
MTPNTPSHNEEVEKIIEKFKDRFTTFGSPVVQGDYQSVEFFLHSNLSTLRNSIESEVREKTLEEVKKNFRSEFTNGSGKYPLNNWQYNKVYECISLTTPVKPLQD